MHCSLPRSYNACQIPIPAMVANRIRLLMPLVGGMLLAMLGFFSPPSVIAQPPIGSWLFSGNANDGSGNGHHGTVFGAALTRDRFGNANSAYRFDGVGDYIVVADAPDLRFATTRAFSISFWIKICAQMRSGYSAGVITKGLGNNAEYSVFLQSNYQVYSWINGWDQQGSLLLSGTWHHVVWVHDSAAPNSQSRHELWVDGQDRSVRTHFPPLLDPTNTDPLYFGIGNTVPSSYIEFNGALDDIRIYDHAISATEIQTLYTTNGWPSPYPDIDVTVSAPGSRIICPGDSVQIQAQTTGPVATLTWKNDIGFSPPNGMSLGDINRNTVWVRPTRTTTYRAIIESDGPCSERRDSSEVTITVRDGPVFTTRGGSKYICVGDSADMGGVASGGTPPYRYSWDAAPGLVNLAKITQRVAPLISTEYYLNVVDANGCRARDTTRMVVLGRPILANLPRQVDICRGDRDTIGVEATGGAGRFGYKWIPASGLSSDTVARPEVNPTTTTRYVVTVTDLALSCTRTDTVQVTLHDRPTADAGGDITICRDSSMVLGAIPAVPGIRYEWRPASGLNDSTLAQPTARPSATTTYHLLATDTLSGCSASDDVTVNVLDGAISAATTTLDFGELDGCTSSREKSVELSNPGMTDVTITAADVRTLGFSIVSPSVPIVLKPGEKLLMVVRFAPVSSGTTSGTVVVHGTPCGVETTVDLRGSKLESLVATNPSSLDFGTSLACQTVVRDTTIVVVNNGTSPVNFALPGILSPYSILAPAFPVTMQPGDTLHVQIRYAPTRGTHSSDLQLPYESGVCRDTLRVRLDGVHELPLLVSDPLLVDAGLLSGCTTSRDTTITLRNSGALPLTIDSTSIPAGWRIIGRPIGPLAPGDTKAITLRFEPQSNGISSGKLRIFVTPCAQELAIDIRGTKQGASFALPDTIDFGEVVFCGDSTVRRIFTLTYSGDTATVGAVPSVDFVPSAPSGFSTTLTPGTTLSANTPTNFAIDFTPRSDGPAAATLQLRLEPCGVDRTVVLRGSRTSPSLAAIPASLDFGSVGIGTVVMKQLNYVNTSRLSIVVDRIDGIAPPFGLGSTIPTLPATLQPGDTLHVAVNYRGASGVVQTSAQAVTSSPCVIIADAVVLAQGSIASEVVLHLPQLTGRPGDHIRVPIVLGYGGTSLERIGAARFEGVLTFNRTLLLAADHTQESSDATTRRVSFSGTRRDTSGTIAEVELIVLLGNAETTTLSIENFHWLEGSDTITTSIDTGSFRLDGICRATGTRLINVNADAALRPVRPNLGRDIVEIDYWLAEDGKTRLSIVDMQGHLVKQLFDGDIGTGQYTTVLDVGGLGSGRYLIILQTPTQLFTQDFEVVR